MALIRLVIASPVRLVREGLAASLHGRDGVSVVDAVSLDAQGIDRIAAAAPDAVLVDLGQTDALATARLLRSASPEAKLVAFALDEIDAGVFAGVDDGANQRALFRQRRTAALVLAHAQAHDCRAHRKARRPHDAAVQRIAAVS